jgi:cation diffusion facilitator family transporter
LSPEHALGYIPNDLENFRYFCNKDGIMSKKVRIARLSIFSNSLLIVLKLVVGVISGSISIISEAIHSFMDLLASIIAFFSVRISDKPADEVHPYGHGKFENISGVVEAMLIFAAAFWIIFEAAKKIIAPKPIEAIGYGVIVMGVSALVNFFVSRKLYNVAKETDSIALEADALHLKTDVYTSVGVASGLLLMMIGDYFFTGSFVHYLDPVIAILVALLILRESFILFKKAYAPLLDVALPEEEISLIRSMIDKYCCPEISYHNLRTRKAGNYKYVDFHMNMADHMTVREAHNLCDIIEADIKSRIKNAEVTIHVENF